MTEQERYLTIQVPLNWVLSFTVCVNDAQPVDNSVFCSGDFVVVLATEQDFAFRINDLHAVPVVPVILGGMVGQCVFWGKLGRLGKCNQKTLRTSHTLFLNQNRTHSIYYI
jgi:hypothetical protein